jgi:glycosyltransferase involved in cell wall biosynthesis
VSSTTGQTFPSDGRLRIVMPVHNAVAYVREAIDSVLADLPTDGELVVVDDGSRDGSSDVIDEAAGRDLRIHVVRNATGSGVSRAFNTGIALPGCPEFVGVAEHDDVVLPGRFRSQLDELTADPGLGAVSSEGRYVGPTGRVAGRAAVGPTNDVELAEMKQRAAEILIPHPAVTYRRAALDAVGLYDETFDGAQDLELINRMVYAGGWKVRMLRSPGVLYRIHDSSMSFSHLSSQRLMTRYIRYRNACQLRGDEPIPYADWLDENRPDPRTRRQWARRDKGALMYRRAGLAWVTRRPVPFVANIVGATVLHPRWVLMKLRVARGQ